MKILIDSAEGSRLIAPHIKPDGLAVLSAGLPSDIVFEGRGPSGKIHVGIEHKRLQDALDCMKSGRLTDIQIPKAKEALDEVWLMIESGISRRNPENGLLEVWWRGRDGVPRWHDTAEMNWGRVPVPWNDFEGWLLSIQIIGRIQLWPTWLKDKPDSARAITNLYHWYQKEWDEHKSFKQLFTAGAPITSAIMLADSIDDDPEGRMRRVAASLPHVGWEISKTCVSVFGSIKRMVNADVNEWSEMLIGRRGKQKRRFGVKAAREVVKTIEEDVRA